MIAPILAMLSDELQTTIPIFSVAGGLAHPVKVNDGGKAKTAPVCHRRLASDGKPQSLVPDSRESGIFFWEAGASQVVRQNALGTMLKNEIRLVVWLNLRRIEPPDTAAIFSSIVGTLENMSVGDPCHYENPKFTITLKKEAPRDPAIFGRWDFSEAETQFLLPPFDFFALDFEITYNLPKKCGPSPVHRVEPVC